jgi:hypothetical protein
MTGEMILGGWVGPHFSLTICCNHGTACAIVVSDLHIESLVVQIVISFQLSVLRLREENPPQSSLSNGGRKIKKASLALSET